MPATTSSPLPTLTQEKQGSYKQVAMLPSPTPLLADKRCDLQRRRFRCLFTPHCRLCLHRWRKNDWDLQLMHPMPILPMLVLISSRWDDVLGEWMRRRMTAYCWAMVTCWLRTCRLRLQRMAIPQAYLLQRYGLCIVSNGTLSRCTHFLAATWLTGLTCTSRDRIVC